MGGGSASGFPTIPDSAVSLNINLAASPHVVGTVSNLPFAPGSFSTVVYEALPYTAFTGDNIGAIAQTVGVLAPGGTLSILTGSAANAAEITGAMEAAGFATISVETMSPLVILGTLASLP